MSPQTIPLSFSAPTQQSLSIGFPDPSKEVKMYLILRPKKTDPKKIEEFDQLLLQPPHLRNYFTHKELEAELGADEDDVDALSAWFKSLGISFKMESGLVRKAKLKGKISAFEKAFQIQAEIFDGEDRSGFLSHRGPIQLPAEHHPRIKMISGFSPSKRIEKRIHHKPIAEDQQDGSAPTGYPLPELAMAYNFPEMPKGATTCIGVIELGGAYQNQDVQAFFANNKLPVPEIIEVGNNTDNDSPVNNVEVSSDIQVAGSLIMQADAAQGSSKIVVYYGNSIMEAMQLAVSDKTNKPSVLSISWAGTETAYTEAQLQELESLFYQASLLGITVLASSGDTGAYDGQTYPNVTLPAVHPLVLGVGGTILVLSNEGQIASEVVWNENGGVNASGGGFSSLYPLPNFQSTVVSRYPYKNSSTRGVPDVAADASGQYGYQVYFNGQSACIGGTSLATPLWAGLIARLNAQLGYSLGFCTPWLYALAGSQAFHPILSGNNQLYPAYPVWNAATGLGSPDGQILLNGLQNLLNKNTNGLPSNT